MTPDGKPNLVCNGLARPRLTGEFSVKRCLRLAKPLLVWQEGTVYTCLHCGARWTAALRGRDKVWMLNEDDRIWEL